MFKKAKGLEICNTILKKEIGFLLIDEKIYLVSQCHVKKIAVKFVIFFSTIFF